MNLTKVLVSAPLITGPCVGAGMLALPVAGSQIGFFPTLIVLIAAWGFMTLTGLLYAELSLWFGKDAHLISMSSELLGPLAKGILWLVFLFIAYASLVAYEVEGGRLSAEVVAGLSTLSLGKNQGLILFSIIAFATILSGDRVLRLVSSLTVGILISLFIVLVFLTSVHFDARYLLRQDWNWRHMASLFPVMMTAFSFPGIVPALVESLDRDVRMVRWTVLVGTGIALMIHLIWLCIVMGSVPYDGEFGLVQAYFDDRNASNPLMHLSDHPYLAAVAVAFALCSISASFLGVCFGLVHFLADGFSVNLKNSRSSLGIMLLIMLPTVAVSWWLGRAFFAALEFTGGFGDAIVSGMAPIAMLWIGVYRQRRRVSMSALASKSLLAILFFISASVFLFELLKAGLSCLF